MLLLVCYKIIFAIDFRCDNLFPVMLRCVKCFYCHRISQMPTTMEQLLEHQWEQGSDFLMQQGQHFDSEYYCCFCQFFVLFYLLVNSTNAVSC